MLEKWWKIDAKMVPKIHENGSKNRPGANIGLQFLGLGGFWSDARISWFSDAFLEAQKIGKSDPKTSQKATWDPRLRTEEVFFWNMGPRAAPRATLYKGTRNKKQGTKDKRIKGYWKKGKLESSKRKQGYFKGSNTPKGLKAWRILKHVLKHSHWMMLLGSCALEHAPWRRACTNISQAYSSLRHIP